MVKPVLVVAPDGYILDIQGPYFSDSHNNDAAILQNEFVRDADRMHRWFQEDDIVIIDRGYRDATNLLQRLGITWKMPAFLPPHQHQLTTEEATESRLVTKSRWIVETRNGIMKSLFKLLQQVVQIAGATINRYHPLIFIQGADAEMANELLVEIEKFNTRNAQRWVQLDAGQLLDFPVLTIQFLKNLTVEVYEVKLAPSYVQVKLQRDDEEFHIEMLRGDNGVPQPGFIKIRVFFRFRNASKYQLWITYRPNGEDDMDYGMADDEELTPIEGYYCTCRSGARTLGTCVHIRSVLWFLGYARHQERIRYPSQRLILTINDAGNRLQPRDIQLPEV